MFNFPVGSKDFKLISKAKYLSDLGATLTSYGIRNGTENTVSGSTFSVALCVCK